MQDLPVTQSPEGADAAGGHILTARVEAILYAALFALSLAVRLAALGRWPLTEGELKSAVGAWRLVNGGGTPEGLYVPILLDANLAFFWLTASSDAVTRLLPALLGSALTVLPYLVRDVLGHVGGLVAAALLAVAPSWVFFSRSSEAPIVGVFFGTVLAVCLWRYQRWGDSRFLRLGALALGLGLAAGPNIYSVLFGLLVIGLVQAFINNGGIRPGLAGLRGGWCRGWNARYALIAAGGFAIAASAFLANPGGVGVSISWAGRWIGDLMVSAGALPWRSCPARLLVYEPLTVALALVGCVGAASRRDGLGLGLAFWAAGALLLGTLLGHRDTIWALDPLLPLVGLAGLGAQRLWEAVGRGFTIHDALYVYLGLILVGFAWLALASYLQSGNEGWRAFLLLMAGTLVLGWVAFWLWLPREALRMGATVLGVLLVLFTVRSTTALAYQTARDPRELLVNAVTSDEVRSLERWVARVAAHQATDPAAYDIAYERGLAPWLEWCLRGYPRARPLSGLGTEESYEAVITREWDESSWPKGEYVGQAFRLVETWDWWAPEITWRDRLRWLLYREPVGEGDSYKVIYWVRSPFGGGDHVSD